MTSLFPGFAEFPLPDDDAWRKWLAVKDARLPDRISSEFDGSATDWNGIAALNATVNNLVAYRSDPDDHWQVPEETLRLLSGDCEDLAVLKRALLRRAGLNGLVLVLAEIARMPQNLQHAFLVVELNGQRRVLDNMFDHLIEPRDYINLVPIKGLMADRGVLFARQTVLAQNQ